MSVALMALVPASLSASGPAGQPRKAEHAVVDHVSDGDTIKVAIGSREEYVRIIGIDTPEVFDGVECGGPEASASMDGMLAPGDRVKLIRDRSQDNRDTYGRLLRYVEFGGRDLGLRQVRKGWARVYVFDFDHPFRRVGPYDRAEDRARQAKRGVWSECGGFRQRGGRPLDRGPVSPPG